jgi:hypothetical protein
MPAIIRFLGYNPLPEGEDLEGRAASTAEDDMDGGQD